jgi:hypothetical protein
VAVQGVPQAYWVQHKAAYKMHILVVVSAMAGHCQNLLFYVPVLKRALNIDFFKISP